MLTSKASAKGILSRTSYLYLAKRSNAGLRNLVEESCSAILIPFRTSLHCPWSICVRLVAPVETRRNHSRRRLALPNRSWMSSSLRRVTAAESQTWHLSKRARSVSWMALATVTKHFGQIESNVPSRFTRCGNDRNVRSSWCTLATCIPVWIRPGSNSLAYRTMSLDRSTHYLSLLFLRLKQDSSSNLTPRSHREKGKRQ